MSSFSGGAVSNGIAEKVAEARAGILTELRKVIVGQDEVVDQVLVALFTGGHCLITGVPGLAKTLLIKTLAEILELDFKRIQFTPDLMPSDILGAEVIEEDRATGKRVIRFIRGPIGRCDGRQDHHLEISRSGLTSSLSHQHV